MRDCESASGTSEPKCLDPLRSRAPGADRRCETWCGNTSKPAAKTIDLCNNPLTKEPKLSQATRIIGPRWSELDQRARALEAGEAPGEGGRTTGAAAHGHEEL